MAKSFLSREAAHRAVTTSPDAPLLPAAQRGEVFAPDLRSISRRLRNEDPIIAAYENKWADRQQHGRIPYEVMARTAVPAAAFGALKKILSSKKPHYRTAKLDATPRQQEYADFANHTVNTMRWRAFVEGPFGMSRQYGFSLSEILVRRGKWNGKSDMILLDRLAPLPQASLDHGFVPRQELGELALESDPRYRCFDIDDNGNIQAVYQFHHHMGKERRIEWRGEQLGSILHIVRNGGDGNPWGESMFFPAFTAWGDWYFMDKLETAYSETSLPILFGTYSTPDGTSRPALHSEVQELSQQQSPMGKDRVWMWPNGDLKSVSPVSAEFVEHAHRYKADKAKQMWIAMGFPEALIASTDDSEADTRSLYQVFFANLLKSTLLDISDALDTVIHRLIRANYGNVAEDDLPIPTWSTLTENEMRVLQTIVPLAMPHVQSDKLPEYFGTFIPGIEEYISRAPADSVAIKRPAPVAEPKGPGTPPPKQPGENRQRIDRATDNPSSGG